MQLGIRILLFASLGAVGPSLPASARIPDLPEAVRLALPDCGCEADPAAVREAERSIAAAPSLAQARERALAASSLARRAIGAARWLAPRSADLARAHERLEAYEGRVAAARSPDEVAWEFGELVQLASLDAPVLADVDIDLGDGGCDYSTGEIIAIVLGFILGIIPGIILLILLC